jgi:hypothetical protein
MRKANPFTANPRRLFTIPPEWRNNAAALSRKNPGGVMKNGCFVSYPLPMRNTLVPQEGHTPWVAGRLFFSVVALAFFISTFFLHFIQ